MKIAIFMPNLSRKCVGGAETYLLGVAESLSSKHEVTIFTMFNHKKKFDINDVYRKYSVKCFNTKYIIFLPVGPRHPYLRICTNLWCGFLLGIVTKGFDLFINGAQNTVIAPPKTKAMHIVHFPDKPNTKTVDCWLTRMMDKKYKESYDVFVPNSEFTAEWTLKYWGIKGIVLNPIINMETINVDELTGKENIILAVDRIVPDKKIKEMVVAFREMCDRGVEGYKLMIIGNDNPQYLEYKKELNELAKGYKIEFIYGLNNEELVCKYKKAKVFWHAKGYGVSEDNPYEMEHFGMTTVEAMANGCVPIVINKAGQKEIVDNGVDGYKWESIEELIKYTENVIYDSDLARKLQIAAIEKAKQYLRENFNLKLTQIVENIL